MSSSENSTFKFYWKNLKKLENKQLINRRAETFNRLRDYSSDEGKESSLL